MIRIYTEDVNRDNVLKILDKVYSAYTVIPAIGRWERVNEKSLVIELASNDIQTALEIANEIKEANKQECVLVVKTLTEDFFV